MALHPSRDALGAGSYILALLQICLAVAIAIVVRQALWHYSGAWHWAPSWWAHTSVDNVCLMSPDRANLCAFTYVVVAVSLIASATLLVTQCCLRRAAACCAALDLWLSVSLAAWWCAAAITATVYGMRADGAIPPLPQEAARTAVWAMGWAETGLFGLSAVLAVWTRHSLRRHSSDLELSVSAPLPSGMRYQRYNDTPFADRSSKWKEVRDSYVARGSISSPKKLSP